MLLGGGLSLGLSGMFFGGGVAASVGNQRIGAGLLATGAALLPIGIPLVIAGKRRVFDTTKTSGRVGLAPFATRTTAGLSASGRF